MKSIVQDKHDLNDKMKENSTLMKIEWVEDSNNEMVQLKYAFSNEVPHNKDLKCESCGKSFLDASTLKQLK